MQLDSTTGCTTSRPSAQETSHRCIRVSDPHNRLRRQQNNRPPMAIQWTWMRYDDIEQTDPTWKNDEGTTNASSAEGKDIMPANARAARITIHNEADHPEGHIGPPKP